MIARDGCRTLLPCSGSARSSGADAIHRPISTGERHCASASPGPAVVRNGGQPPPLSRPPLAAAPSADDVDRVAPGMSEMELTALIGLIGAFIVATPGYLAWRVAQHNTHKAEESAARALAAEERAAETARITAQVKAAIDDLRPMLNGRLTELLKAAEDRGRMLAVTARSEGHRMGVEDEQARMRPADGREPGAQS